MFYLDLLLIVCEYNKLYNKEGLSDEKLKSHAVIIETCRITRLHAQCCDSSGILAFTILIVVSYINLLTEHSQLSSFDGQI